MKNILYSESYHKRTAEEAIASNIILSPLKIEKIIKTIEYLIPPQTIFDSIKAKNLLEAIGKLDTRLLEPAKLLIVQKVQKILRNLFNEHNPRIESILHAQLSISNPGNNPRISGVGITKIVERNIKNYKEGRLSLAALASTLKHAATRDKNKLEKGELKHNSHEANKTKRTLQNQRVPFKNDDIYQAINAMNAIPTLDIISPYRTAEEFSKEYEEVIEIIDEQIEDLKKKKEQGIYIYQTKMDN